MAEKKKELLYSGPFLDDEENCVKFKQEHKNTYEKNNRLYAKENVQFNLRQFLDIWKTKNAKIIQQMYIENLFFM